MFLGEENGGKITDISTSTKPRPMFHLGKVGGNTLKAMN